MKDNEESYVIGYDPANGKDLAVLVIFKRSITRLEEVAAYYGDEAIKKHDEFVNGFIHKE